VVVSVERVSGEVGVLYPRMVWSEIEGRAFARASAVVSVGGVTCGRSDGVGVVVADSVGAVILVGVVVAAVSTSSVIIAANVAAAAAAAAAAVIIIIAVTAVTAAVTAAAAAAAAAAVAVAVVVDMVWVFTF
jgi:hypothetical protein